MARCIICAGDTERIIDEQISCEHIHCLECGFIYKDKIFHLPADVEKDNYNRHNNSMESIGYVNMFNKFIDEFITPLDTQHKVLEFGSGPGPVLYELLKRRDYDISHYDPYYHNDLEYRKQTYQLITSTEVVEHFFDPMKEFKHLSDLLEKDGYLVIMTNFRNTDIEGFLKW